MDVARKPHANTQPNELQEKMVVERVGDCHAASRCCHPDSIPVSWGQDPQSPTVQSNEPLTVNGETSVGQCGGFRPLGGQLRANAVLLGAGGSVNCELA